jgi:hypothetical protein
MERLKKLEILIQRLYDQTKAGKIAWEETSLTDVFQAAFPKYAVQLIRHERDDTRPGVYTYSLHILNDRNAVIEEVTDRELRPSGVESDQGMLLREMYEEVRRQALGVDEALDTLLRELSD